MGFRNIILCKPEICCFISSEYFQKDGLSSGETVASGESQLPLSASFTEISSVCVAGRSRPYSNAGFVCPCWCLF